MTDAVEALIPARFHRGGPPVAEVLASLMPLRKALGITRVADITGLDRVGIPVVQAVRPFSLSNAVSQGKGGTLAEAAVSAIMESAEGFFAERLATFKTIVADASSLGMPSDRFEHYLQPDAKTDWSDRQTTWIGADNLINSSQEMVPLELVHTAYVYPPRDHDGMFYATTTGLAASLNETDAVVHGILECIERDAIARANWTHGFFQKRRIDLKTIDDPGLLKLLGALEERELLVGLWHAFSPVGLPVILCHLMEKRPREAAILHHPADGSATGFDVTSAIGQAVYEAAQSRLAAISGARDDITRLYYPKYPDWQKINAHRRLLTEGPCSVHFHALTREDVGYGQRPLSTLLAKLEGCGIDSVNMVRIDTAPFSILSVVKIIIPALIPLLAE